MNFLKPARLEYKGAPMWADGLRVGDIFYYPPTQKTFLIFLANEPNPSDVFGQQFVAYEYTPQVELFYYAYRFTKCVAIPRTFRILSWLRRHGYVTAPEEVKVAWWPLLRTFTTKRAVRNERIDKLMGYTNKTIYYRDQNRKLAHEILTENGCSHSAGMVPYICTDCYSNLVHTTPAASSSV